MPENPPLHRNPFVWVFLIGIVTITLIRPLLRHVPDPPPVTGELPEFHLVDATGRAFGSADLAGRVWVADFFYTRCAGDCPLLTAAMTRLGDRLERAEVDRIHLVSISVDPEFDTPERLAEYGERHGIDPTRWTLLTGEPDAIRALVVDGFGMPLEMPRDAARRDIVHGRELVIVDGARGLRGSYPSHETGVDEVFHRAQHVLLE